ncbi:MAG: hypothetical protein RIF32_10610, partial [Leptospirales bacterium]
MLALALGSFFAVLRLDFFETFFADFLEIFRLGFFAGFLRAGAGTRREGGETVARTVAIFEGGGKSVSGRSSCRCAAATAVAGAG